MTNQMGKRELNKARKRAEIVDIATRYFFEHGYGATSMSAIAEELGGSKATLWAHFGSKEDLFAAVIDKEVASFSADVDEVLAGQTYSVPALRRACQRFLECLMRENSIRLFSLVISQGGRFPEIREMFYSRGPAKIRKCVHDFFATRFPPDQAEKLARFTMAAISGYRSDILLRPNRPSAAECEAYVASLVDMITCSIPDSPASPAGQRAP